MRNVLEDEAVVVSLPAPRRIGHLRSDRASPAQSQRSSPELQVRASGNDGKNTAVGPSGEEGDRQLHESVRRKKRFSAISPAVAVSREQRGDAEGDDEEDTLAYASSEGESTF